ncbi:MAG: hypothetical protein IJH12_04290 [Clostridia bacterium]|nr:hypothetical protein [Clostridia bacterium]
MENEINYNEDLKNLLNQVKKIVWNFVSTNYDIDIQNKVKDALDKLSIKIDNNQKLNEYGEAYCNGSNIYLSEAYYLKQRGKLDLIKTVLHECGHSFSEMVAGREIEFPIFEEGFAELFSEICINSFVENNNINYISDEENRALKESDYIQTDSRIKELAFIKNILYALSTKEKDVDAVGEYFFESKEDFFKICSDILGQDFDEKIVKKMDSQKMEFGRINTDNYVQVMNDDLYTVLAESINGQISEDVFSKNPGYRDFRMYSVNTRLLQALFFQKKIENEWLGEEFSTKTITENKIKLISDNAGNSIIRHIAYNGFSPYFRDIISIWYDKCNGELEEFNKILGITGAIPFEQVSKIVERRIEESKEYETPSKYELTKSALFKYNTIFVESEKNKSIEYLVDSAEPHEYADMLSIISRGMLFFDEDFQPTEEIIKYINLSKPTKKQLKAIASIYTSRDNINIENISEIYDFFEASCFGGYTSNEGRDLLNIFISQINEMIIVYGRFDDIAKLIGLTHTINRIKNMKNIYVDDVQNVLQKQIERLKYEAVLKNKNNDENHEENR